MAHELTTALPLQCFLCRKSAVMRPVRGKENLTLARFLKDVASSGKESGYSLFAIQLKSAHDNFRTTIRLGLLPFQYYLLG